MKKTIRFLFGIFLLTGLITKTNAQSGTVVAGGNASGTGGTASYSVGEVEYTTITSSGGIVIQGIQQAYTVADLPITLLEFNALVTDKKQVALTWVTVSEHNNKYFEVERSQDGASFEKVLIVDSKGNSTNAQDYASLDASPLTGVSYYRLKQTDINGKSTYSKSVRVNIALENELKAYPNPTTSILHLQISGAATKQLSYAIYSINGKLIAEQKINNDLTIISTSNLSNGVYLLQVKDKGTLVKSFKLIKN